MAKVTGSFFIDVEFTRLMQKPTEQDWKNPASLLTNMTFDVDNITFEFDVEPMYNVTRNHAFGDLLSAGTFICEMTAKFTAVVHARVTKPESISFTKKTMSELFELIDEVLFDQQWQIQKITHITIEGKEYEENN
jgi:hypothetical protein